MLEFISGIVELEITSQISELWFGLLTISVVLIAMGGYIINDIQDVDTDQNNNKPNPVGKLISSEKAYLLYQITTVLGLALSFGVGYYLDNYNLGIIQLIAAMSLWFYSYYFKTEFLIGNVIVAFVVALVPLTVGIYEVSLIQIAFFNKIENFQDFNFNFIAFWFIGYAIFVFLITLAREVLKDMEDTEGDKLAGASTLPIQMGMNWANAVVTIIYTVVIGALIYIQNNFLPDRISLVFIVLLIGLLIFNLYVSWKGNAVLFSASSWNKLLSLVGLSYLVALAYIINNQLFFNV
jgi:4-hydroxybenzoate polyprenyltransferase